MSNQAKLQIFYSRVLADVATTQSLSLVSLGYRLGLYQTLADGIPRTVLELANYLSLSEDMVRHWLWNQVGSGYLEYDATVDQYRLPQEHAEVLLGKDSGYSVRGVVRFTLGIIKNEEQVAELFRNSREELPTYSPEVDEGMEEASQAQCEGLFLTQWLPKMKDVVGRFEKGARVADLGCGSGAVLFALNRRFRLCQFLGLDTDTRALDRARQRALRMNLSASISFAEPSWVQPTERFDTILSLDSLHHFHDPHKVAEWVKASLTDQGVWLVVEPIVESSPPQGLDNWSRLVSSTFVLYCLPVSGRFKPNGSPLLVGEDEIRRVLKVAGFSSVQRVVEHPFHLVLAARP